MPHLHAMLRGELKEEIGSPAVGDEDAHDVFVGFVALQARRAQHADEALRVPLDAQLEDLSAVLLQAGNRTLRRDCPFVEHDDVVAGVFDVGQQV